MLTEVKRKLLDDLVNEASHDELIWINGFLAGIARSAGNGMIEANNFPGNTITQPNRKITVLFATETGNSKKLAGDFSVLSKSQKLKLKCGAIEQYKLSDLAKEDVLLLIISTHGDGEPPKSARKFFKELRDSNFSLTHLRYAVLALGDSAYPLFCKAGEDLDSLLKDHGANAILPVEKCDVDYKPMAHSWFRTISTILGGLSENQPAMVPLKGEKSNYLGKISKLINLNGKGSNKKTFHIEISCNEQPYYEPGDSIAVIPHNRREQVEAIVQLTRISPQEIVEHKRGKSAISDLLTRQLNISCLSERVIKRYSQIIGQDVPATGIDLVNLLRIYPLKDEHQVREVLLALEGISPRLYSISSSPASHENEIHITVGLHSFDTDQGRKFGLCSSWLQGLSEEDEISFTIKKNHAFKLPDDDVAIVMIGPGTGIAPFRSFIAERESRGASGKSWLFFGDQHFTTDFLYQTELQEWVNNETLSKLSLAFSRDGLEKLYVQHKIQQHAKELVEWIDQGCVLYLCGSAHPMASEVEMTLASVISEQQGISNAEAELLLEDLKQKGRLQVDAY